MNTVEVGNEKKILFRMVLFTVYFAVGLFILNPPERIWDFAIFERFDFILRTLIVVVTGILVLLHLIRKKTVDPFLVFYLIFDGILVLSTFLFQGDLKKAVWSNTIVPAILVMLIGIGIQYSKKITVRVIYYYYYVCILFNCISVLRYTGLLTAYVPLHEIAFLGNRNVHIYYYLVFLFTGYYGLQSGIFRHRWHYFLGYGICLLTVAKAQGLTTATILLCWGCFMILIRPAEYVFTHMPGIGVLMNTLLFLVLQIYTLIDGSRLFSWLSIFKKNATFKGRTSIWRIVWKQISISPLTGFGYRNMWDVIGYAHPHNLYLHITLNRGLIGFGLFVFLIILLQKSTACLENPRTRALILFFISCILLAGQFDEHLDVFYAMYGALIFYLCKSEAKNDSGE